MVLVLGGLFLATYIIYTPPFHVTYGALPGAIGNLVHVLSVITIDADITEFYDLVSQNSVNGVFSLIYIVLMGILHVALPAISALTAVAVLFRCFSSVQMFFANIRRHPMFVFLEVNEKSLYLAKSLEKIKCDIVFANASSDSVNRDINSTHGIILKDEGLLELGIKSKKGKDIYFFCISEDEDLSLSNTLQLIERYSKEKEADQERIHIYQFSRHEDFSLFIDSADKGALDVHCVNEYEQMVYNLLLEYPLIGSAEDESMHVLLYGLSRINTIALRSIAWVGQISGVSLRVSVVGTDIENNISDLRIAVPGLFTDRYDIRFYNCKNEKETLEIIGRECSDAKYIILSEDSDNATMERGVEIRRLYYRLDPKFAACPSIFCYIKDPSKSTLVKRLATAESNPSRKMSYDLIPFGGMDALFTYDGLIDSSLERLAKNVHLAYEEIFSDGEINVKEALKRYNVFEVNKRSNRANALHIRYKLRMLGLDCTLDENAEEVRLEDYYTEDSLERMSVSEHDRWMAFLETEGWIPSAKEDVDAYRESGISKGRHNCPILKMHPYICEYEKLKDLSLELENKDTTVYDRELILRIPDILGDKWNVSGKKYKITRIKQ